MTTPREQHLRALETRVQSALCEPEFMRTVLSRLVLVTPQPKYLPFMVALQRLLKAHMESDREMMLCAAQAVGGLLDQHAAETIKNDLHSLAPIAQFDQPLPSLLMEQGD